MADFLPGCFFAVSFICSHDIAFRIMTEHETAQAVVGASARPALAKGEV
jgi:hypothetical protein